MPKAASGLQEKVGAEFKLRHYPLLTSDQLTGAETAC
jgi:hypothetical protein